MERFLFVSGIEAAQTPRVIQSFSTVINNFDTIIEIGFHRGGFTLWLFNNKKESTKLVAYDIDLSNKQVDNPKIDFRYGDCFSEITLEEIKKLIYEGNKTLLLCDGGDKEREFNLYSQFLKRGDVIMCHDYAHSQEDFAEICSSRGWLSPSESHYINIAESVELNKLIPFEYNMFKSVFWGAFTKL